MIPISATCLSMLRTRRSRCFLLVLALLAITAGATAQAAGPLQAIVVWTTSSAASSITASATTGVETSGPVLSQIYFTPATITSGIASCPTFSATVWTLASPPGGISGNSSAANANTFAVTAVTVGAIYCFAVTDAFAISGSGVSTAGVSAPVTIIILGGAAAPSGVGVTVGVNPAG